MATPRRQTPEQAWAKHATVGAPDDCWPWAGPTNTQGYGVVSVNRRQVRAHRLAYELFVGPIPEGMEVCHTCDNPPCVNWRRHLFLGTKADNQHDKRVKGRAAKGEHNGGGGKLTDDDVRAIRVALSDGETKTAIGIRFGVSRVEVAYIATGRHWGHVR